MPLYEENPNNVFPGGRFRLPNGKLVNANGEPIEEETPVADPTVTEPKKDDDKKDDKK